MRVFFYFCIAFQGIVIPENCSCFMVNIVQNTPSLLIPKEIFKEEQIHKYWNVLHPDAPHENIGKDELESYFLLYPKPKEVDSIHEISVLYKEFLEKFPNQENAICINLYDKSFNMLVLKNRSIIYSGYFLYSVNEDILYHITNIYRHFFDDGTQIVLGYQQLLPDALRLLNNYYEMVKI